VEPKSAMVPLEITSSIFMIIINNEQIYEINT
jgi:hypothetical protein